MDDRSVSMDALTGNTIWKEYISTGLPLSYDVSWPVLLSYTFLFLGLYWLMSSLWAYFQIVTMNTPPGPIPIPFLGNMGYMLLPSRWLKLLRYKAGSGRSARDTKRQVSLPAQLLLSNMSKLYGKIYGFFIGMRLVVFLNDFDIVKDAMVNHSDVFSDRPSDPMIQIITKRKGTVGDLTSFCTFEIVVAFAFYKGEKYDWFTKLMCKHTSQLSN